MKIAYFDCFSGISGDMTLGAFLDAGLPMKTLTDAFRRLKIKGYSVKRSKVHRGPIAGTKFDCINKEDNHRHRSLKELLRIIDKSSLEPRVKSIAKQIFIYIGSAEAKVHGIPKGRDVKLHELGQIDSIIDIVGTAVAIDVMGIDKVYASNIAMGRTSTITKHGVIPVPAPATLELLKGAPVSISELRAEVVTPTGAGILATLSEGFGPTPVMDISHIGYGAGSREIDGMPNMLRIVIGQSDESFSNSSVTLIETNIDDMNPQYYENVFERLFRAGALDAYITPIQMKKNRPGSLLSVICDNNDVSKMSSIIFEETTTIGLRFSHLNRLVLERKVVVVNTKYGKIRVKVSSPGKGARTVSCEYDDCLKIASKKKMPVRTVYEEAQRQAFGKVR